MNPFDMSDDEVLAFVKQMPNEARTRALAAVEQAMQKRGASLLTAPPQILVTLRLGIQEGITAALMVMLEFLETTLTEEELAEAEAEFEKLKPKLHAQD